MGEDEAFNIEISNFDDFLCKNEINNNDVVDDKNDDNDYNKMK